jgi:hypothetical protein
MLNLNAANPDWYCKNLQLPGIVQELMYLVFLQASHLQTHWLNFCQL